MIHSQHESNSCVTANRWEKLHASIAAIDRQRAWVYQQTISRNTYISAQITAIMNETGAVGDWLRAHPVVWFLSLALVTGSLYGVIQFGFGESTELAVAGGIAWGVFWAGGFFIFRRLLSE